MARNDDGPYIVLAAAIHALIIVLGFALYIEAQKYQFREAVKAVQQKSLTTR
jgi:hypothetical protein